MNLGFRYQQRSSAFLSAHTVPAVSAQWPACPVLDQGWSVGLLQGLIVCGGSLDKVNF